MGKGFPTWPMTVREEWACIVERESMEPGDLILIQWHDYKEPVLWLGVSDNKYDVFWQLDGPRTRGISINPSFFVRVLSRIRDAEG